MKNDLNMNKFVPLFLFLQFALLQLSGCSLAVYPIDDITKSPSIVLADVNKPPFADVKLVDRNDVNSDGSVIKETRIQVIPEIELELNTIFTMKYHRSLLYKAPNVNVPIKFPNGSKYIGTLDTGFGGSFLLTSDVALDNKLTIRPWLGGFIGIFHISDLSIGSAKILNAFGDYKGRQWQFRILNIPIYKDNSVLIGLKFFQTFDYVMFDKFNQEVTFSKDGSFKPEKIDLWSSYPFEIKSNRIIVEMPINGKVYELFFDSGGGKPGLCLNKYDWQIIETGLDVKQIRKSHYYNYSFGRLPCQIAKVSELLIGEKNCKIPK